MSDEDFRPDSSASRGVVITLLAGLLIVGLVLTYRFVGNPADVIIAEKDKEIAAVEAKIEKKNREAEEKRQETQRRQELNKVLPWSMVLTRLNRIENQLDDSTASIEKIEATVEQLLTKPGASAIAESEKQIEAFRNIQLAGTLFKDRSYEAKADYQSIRARFDNATSSKAKTEVLPSDELKAEVEKVNEDATQLASETRKALATLQSLASQVPTPVATVSLKEAVSARQAKEEEAYLAQQAEVLSAVRAEERAKALQQVQEQERARLQAIAKLDAEKSQAEVDAIDDETDAMQKIALGKKAAGEKAARIADDDDALVRDMAKVRSLLAPFIAKANVQVNANKQSIVTEEQLPVSWTIIQGARVLDTTAPVYWRQYIFALEATGRDRGGAPVQPFDYKNIGPAQLLLKKHGEAMVRAGLLSP